MQENFREIIDPNDGEFRLEDVVPPKVADNIRNLPIETVSLSESDLIQNGDIADVDWKLRVKFWQEFRTITNPQARGSRVPKLKLTNIYKGVCTAASWSRRIANPFKLAFIIRPINDFEEENEISLQIAASRLYELVTMDITGKDGKVDVRRGELLLKTISMVADRARGLAVIRSQSVNVNVDKKVKAGSEQVQISDINELDKKIAELSSKLGNSSQAILEGEVVE